MLETIIINAIVIICIVILIDWSYNFYLFDYTISVLSQLQWKFAESIYILLQLITLLGPTIDIDCDSSGAAIWQIWGGKLRLYDKPGDVMTLQTIFQLPKAYENCTLMPHAYKKMQTEIHKLCAPVLIKCQSQLQYECYFEAADWADLISRVALSLRILRGEKIDKYETKWPANKELEYIKSNILF